MQANNDAVTNPHQIEQVRNRFELWRSGHHGRRPLPQDLWSAAAQLAQQHGVHRIAKALRLSYDSLRQHLPTGAALQRKPRKTPAKFVELLPLSSALLPECSIELENARGAKIKIQLRGPAMDELSRLTQLFWREL